VFSAVSNSLEAMGVEQYLAAFVFLACYSLALSQFCGRKGRTYAAVGTLLSAAAFVRFTTPWVHGVLVVAFTVIAIGGFAAAVWGLWALLGWDQPAHPLARERIAAPASMDGALPTRPAPLSTRPAPLPAPR
jgi:hypothetical protein